ncbi:hypothetical protein [Dyadobacter sp. LHD-138]|uniref:hypothetical protein n=1 Tax=Dyadobacter sp. LHD-138 TaxID=3071413 RepID=UPI0027E148BA|nr:hypothetical protein [Dyadobacter sp. LHD-138]MDQ6477426.1 hypothetical protein [Dyadobacter sp. LHD-138]
MRQRKERKYLPFFGEVRYTPNIRIDDILLLKQKRNFFYTKTAEIGYPANDIVINPQNIYQGISPVTLSLGIRLAM